MGAPWLRWLWVVSVLVSLASCTRTFAAKVAAPNPMALPAMSARTVPPVTIVTGDVELRMPRLPRGANQVVPYRSDRYPLFNAAQFTVVNKDRLRFHVQLDHKWQEWADLRHWHAELIDEHGHHLAPVALERARTRLLTVMWDNEIRSPVRNAYGDVVALNNDAWLHRVPLGSLSVFRGRGDFVFVAPELFNARVRKLTLRVSRPGLAFDFTWELEVPPAAATQTAAAQATPLIPSAVSPTP